MGEKLYLCCIDLRLHLDPLTQVCRGGASILQPALLYNKEKDFFIMWGFCIFVLW